MNYLKDGKTRREKRREAIEKQAIQNSINDARKKKNKSGLPTMTESLKEEIDEQIVVAKTKLKNSIQKQLSTDTQGDLSHLLGNHTVEDIDYGASEFKNLIITYIEAFPEDYELDLDDLHNGLMYGYIYETEGIDPEVKEAVSKLKVKYKAEGWWFMTNTILIKKGEIDVFPKHSTKGFMKTFEKFKPAVKRNTGREF